MYHLPLFPLHTVLFPGIPLDLQVFEPRYRQLVEHCMQSEPVFGVNLIRQGEEANGPLPMPFAVGCTARIIDVHTQPDGRLHLTALGGERYLIEELDFSLPYLAGQVRDWPLEPPLSLPSPARLKRLTLTYLKLIGRLVGEVVDLRVKQLPAEPLRQIYLSAALLQLPAIEKQPLLEAPGVSQLYRELLRLYRRELAVLGRQPALDERASRRLAWLN